MPKALQSLLYIKTPAESMGIQTANIMMACFYTGSKRSANVPQTGILNSWSSKQKAFLEKHHCALSDTFTNAASPGQSLSR
eukprot:scaffold55255_cov18-Tisochrysis_lutea.AAC.1